LSSGPNPPASPVYFSALPSRCGRASSVLPSRSPTWPVSLSVPPGFISCPPTTLGPGHLGPLSTGEGQPPLPPALLMPSTPPSRSLSSPPPSSLRPSAGLEPGNRDNRSRKEAGFGGGGGGGRIEEGVRTQAHPPPSSSGKFEVSTQVLEPLNPPTLGSAVQSPDSGPRPLPAHLGPWHPARLQLGFGWEGTGRKQWAAGSEFPGEAAGPAPGGFQSAALSFSVATSF
jgi:hypothetical protein